MSPLRLPAFFNGATSSRYILSVLSSDTYQQRFSVNIRLRNDRALLHKPIHVISCEEGNREWGRMQKGYEAAATKWRATPGSSGMESATNIAPWTTSARFVGDVNCSANAMLPTPTGVRWE